MDLNNDLIMQFAKIAKIDTKNKDATTVRGTVHISEGRNYIQLDGATENSLTPAESTVEVSEGDRVIAAVKDHSIIITGNKTNPSIGTVTAGNLRSTIEQTASAITTRVENLEGNDAKFSEFKQTVEGFSFMHEDGSGVKISHGDINLTGAITWSDLNTEVQDVVDFAQNKANKAYDIATDNILPNYIKSTYIDGSSVNSPAIRGGLISGAKFTNLTGTVENPTYDHWLEIGDSDGYYGFTFSSTGYSRIFAVYNGDFGFTTLYGKRGFGSDGAILTHDAAAGRVQAQGNTWDFSNVNVTGLPTAEVDPLDAWPVGSIYLAYNHTSPASLFGGSWTRISPYFLYATGSNGVIGETGYMAMADGGGVLFIKISAWRRIS